MERHIPAPLMVTLLTATCPGTLNVPGGIQTVPPDPAALIADAKAADESLAPVGSAPYVVMATEPAGWLRAAPTFSKSAKSIVYEEAVSSLSICSRNLVPAAYVVLKSRLTSS